LWTTPAKVREIIGLSEEDAPDELLNQYIDRAQRDMFNDISIRVKDEELVGSINGENTTFSFSHYPLCDWNFDNIVDENDIKVYKWGKRGSIELKEYCPVSSIDDSYGKVYLASAPASTYEVVTADYYYVNTDVVRTEDIRNACSFLAAYYYVLGEYLLVPLTISHGGYRLTIDKPYDLLRKEYEKAIDRILQRPYRKGEHEDIEQIREEVTE
jgi:hypothetical protein